MRTKQQLEDIYKRVKISEVNGRFISLKEIDATLTSLSSAIEKKVIGTSVKGAPIHQLKIGSGTTRVLIWSQMHGNESTTTKSVLDFLSLLQTENATNQAVKSCLSTYTFYIIPILNPDGAAVYTRVNANLVDLNRDAQELSQPESVALSQAFEEICPDLCLNMHGQRTIFGFEDGRASAISFLAPAADPDRSITPARTVAMKHIECMNAALQEFIPHQVGRYDDSFNANCVGDAFMMRNTPTILFEAGHCDGDYDREKSREYIFYALCELFDVSSVVTTSTLMPYGQMPENKKNYCDVLLKNTRLEDEMPVQDIAVQFIETVINGVVAFIPSILSFNATEYGHRSIDLQGETIEIETEGSLIEGATITLVYNKFNKKPISLKIS